MKVSVIRMTTLTKSSDAIHARMCTNTHRTSRTSSARTVTGFRRPLTTDPSNSIFGGWILHRRTRTIQPRHLFWDSRVDEIWAIIVEGQLARS